MEKERAIPIIPAILSGLYLHTNPVRVAPIPINKEITNRIEVVADMDQLRKLISEYGKTGSNLNQIARYFNTGGESSAEMKDEIHQCISDLFSLRKEVLRMAGELHGHNQTH